MHPPESLYVVAGSRAPSAGADKRRLKADTASLATWAP